MNVKTTSLVAICRSTIPDYQEVSEHQSGYDSDAEENPQSKISSRVREKSVIFDEMVRRVSIADMCGDNSDSDEFSEYNFSFTDDKDTAVFSSDDDADTDDMEEMITADFPISNSVPFPPSNPSKTVFDDRISELTDCGDFDGLPPNPAEYRKTIPTGATSSTTANDHSNSTANHVKFQEDDDVDGMGKVLSTLATAVSSTITEEITTNRSSNQSSNTPPAMSNVSDVDAESGSDSGSMVSSSTSLTNRPDNGMIKSFMIEKTLEAIAIRLHYSSMPVGMLKQQETAIMKCYTKANYVLAVGAFAWDNSQYWKTLMKRKAAEKMEALGRRQYATMVLNEQAQYDFSLADSTVNPGHTKAMYKLRRAWEHRINSNALVKKHYERMYRESTLYPDSDNVKRKWHYRRACNIYEDDLKAVAHVFMQKKK